MKMKQLVLAAALAAPFMAQADLKAMDDSALASVTGQDGISISGNFNGSIGRLEYKDDGGSLNMTNIGFTGFNISNDDALKVDVVSGTVNGANTEQLAITMPAMTGTVSIGGMYVGGTYVAASGGNGARMDGAGSLGGLSLTDMNMAGTTIKIWGH